MALAAADLELIAAELGREPTRAESALFENLWSEHCAYRSSRALLRQFDSEDGRVVVGPGDDAAVVSLTDDWYLTMGIESHNHPSYVDPYDGAATGVGGIVRDTLSMGAYPIALADCLYFGSFENEHSLYLFEGVVEGIADYGNAIGVPTVQGSVQFHDGYEGNPLVNVACVGLVQADRMVTAVAEQPGNKLILIGNATGRDGLGGASFASEDLAADAETADRPAVQVGDPYTEKLLIEANEALIDEGLIVSARDLGAAGLGGASSELVAKGGLGARIALDEVHQREPAMNPMEILLAESQERMCYEVAPTDVERVIEIAERFELGCSVIGEVTDTGRYVTTFAEEIVVDVPVDFLCEGAPLNDLPTAPPSKATIQPRPLELESTFTAVLGDPNTASKSWVYRQYDHEVGVRTAVRPGDDSAILAVPETGNGLAIAAGCESTWTAAAPYAGARAVALEVATNVAVKGASPIAAVDCLNGGNPETPQVYHEFSHSVAGLADMCRDLNIPVVGGNVSLYNDSPSGPIPPTPTVAMTGVTDGFEAPGMHLTAEGSILLIGPLSENLGGSHAESHTGGNDVFPSLPTDPETVINRIHEVATLPTTGAIHDISHGGIAVSIAEMVTQETGATITINGPNAALFSERPGRAIVQTTDPAAVKNAVEDSIPIHEIGQPTTDGILTLETGDAALSISYDEIVDKRDIISQTLQ